MRRMNWMPSLAALVDRSRTPTFADAPNLPYIQALVKGSLRWRPALPLGIPHTTTEDDWYEGMFIPKRTVCVVNFWLISGNATMTRRRMAPMLPASIQRGSWMSTVSSSQILRRRATMGTVHMALGGGHVSGGTPPMIHCSLI